MKHVVDQFEVEVPDGYLAVSSSAGQKKITPRGGSYARGAVARAKGEGRETCPYSETNVYSRSYAAAWQAGWQHGLATKRV